MEKLRLATIALLSFTSCASIKSDIATEHQTADARSEISSYCSRTPIRFNEKLDTSSAQDVALAEKFGSVCKELSRQEGLDFGAGLTAYECRVYYPRMDSDFVTEKYEYGGWWGEADPQSAATYIAQLRKNEDDFNRAFGVRLSLDIFDPVALNADDLMESEYEKTKKKKSTNGREFEKGTPIAYQARENGLTATIIILNDASTGKQRFLISREELSGSLKGVRSLAGVASLLYLQKLTGISLGADRDQGRSDFGSPICTASTIESDPSGWTIRGIEIQRNCQRPVIRDVHVSRLGKITIERNNKIEGYSSCFD